MSGCADDLTAVDVELTPTLLGRVAGGNASNVTNLYGTIDHDNIFGLNLTVPEDARGIVKTWDARESLEKWVDSGEDDEMIVHVPFTENVRVRSVVVKLGRGETCPRRVRLYVNSPHGIDFSDESKPTQDLALLENAEQAVEYPVRVSAFASVNSITLFFSDSPGGERSRVYYIGFKGESKRPLKEPGSKLDLAASNAADAPVDRLKETAPGSQSTIR
ncbi:hypothetical protein FS837_002753 [Tulasnella sp. UAMH 9824]|nr:hypothetical protein FS837_002753 [Tulasnella sp. UAMH 9824]